jgi:diguanylate cyclase (GGDEF)-like protein
VERIANNSPIEETAALLAALIEEGVPDASALILVLRDGSVEAIASAPDRDLFLRDASGCSLNELPNRLPCWGPRSVVAAVGEAPEWRSHHEAARHYGVRACWWHPIINPAGEMLGGIIVQLGVQRAPDECESELLGFATRMAGIAVEQRNLIAELTFQAHYDALTGLANLHLFRDRMQQAVFLAQARRGSVALLHMDLDRFKVINDVLGHAVGDEVLLQTARRLKSCLRRTDLLARSAADEFLILAPDIDVNADIHPLLERLAAALKPPFDVDGHELHVSASTGISIFPGDALDSRSLERHAGTALSRAKRTGRGESLFFEPEMERYSADRLELEIHLRSALPEKQLVLHYQREIDLRTGAMAGCEALLRWAHPKLGMVSPASFIPIAEETGLITDIGPWVLETACADAVRWRRIQPVRVAVNISAVQFDEPGLPALVTKVLKQSGLPPALLEIELTESVLLEDGERARDRVQQLRSLGVGVAIDDFGTGHASLTYLQRLPATSVKIDRRFVAEITPECPEPPLLRSIVAMAHAMGMRTVAEGVEDAQQYASLAEMGCDVAQGFFIHRPVEASRLLEPSGPELASLVNLAERVGGAANNAAEITESIR